MTRTTTGFVTSEKAGRRRPRRPLPRRLSPLADSAGRRPSPRRPPRLRTGWLSPSRRVRRAAAAAVAGPRPTPMTTGARCTRTATCRCPIRQAAGSPGRIQRTTGRRSIRPAICPGPISAAAVSLDRVLTTTGRRCTRPRTRVRGPASLAAEYAPIRTRRAMPAAATCRRARLVGRTSQVGCRANRGQACRRPRGIQNPIVPACCESRLNDRPAGPAPSPPFRRRRLTAPVPLPR